jgi:hypothetical protein
MPKNTISPPKKTENMCTFRLYSLHEPHLCEWREHVQVQRSSVVHSSVRPGGCLLWSSVRPLHMQGSHLVCLTVELPLYYDTIFLHFWMASVDW